MHLQRIWSEHLGLSGAEAIQDPVTPEFWDGVWHDRINTNTKIFEDVFRALPNNHVHTWTDVCTLCLDWLIFVCLECTRGWTCIPWS